MSESPKCICGATMIQSSDDVKRGNMTLLTPNGKYSCWPCSEVKRELLAACKLACQSFETVNAIGNLDQDDFDIWKVCEAAVAKAELTTERHKEQA